MNAARTEKLVRTLGFDPKARFHPLPESEWSYRYRDEMDRRANTVTAAQVAVLQDLIAGRKPRQTSALAAALTRLVGLGLVMPDRATPTERGRIVAEQIGARKSAVVSSLVEEHDRAKRRSVAAAAASAAAREDEARALVIELAKQASRQQCSIDELFDAVYALERAEAEAKTTGDDEERLSGGFGR
jgi:hypothetical protein